VAGYFLEIYKLNPPFYDLIEVAIEIANGNIILSSVMVVVVALD
jgi:hypothetical protein